MKLSIIGYGNPLRRDDGIGWVLAQQLEDDNTDAQIKVIVAHQLLPEMTDWVSQADCLVFIDAVYGEEAGQWSCFPFEANFSLEGLPSLVHKLSPTQLLLMANALFGHMPEAFMITVTGTDFGYGEGLSKELEAVVPEIRNYIVSEFI